MFAIKFSIMLITGCSLAMAKSDCKRGWHNMCCIADYDLVIQTTGCVPLSSMPSGSDGRPYCGELVGIDTETYFFENCCNFPTLFSQTCATVNGVQTCKTSKPGIKCT